MYTHRIAPLMLFVLTSTSYGALSFDKITNPSSSICQNVSSQATFEHRLHTLLAYASKEDDYTYHLTVSKVPYRVGNKIAHTKLAVSFFLFPGSTPHTLESVAVRITPHTPFINKVLPEYVTYFFGHTTNTNIPYIRGRYEKIDGQWHRHSGRFEMPHHVNGQKTISGTTVYHLFHSFQELLKPDLVSIGDSSQLPNGLLLRILRLFTSEDNQTFYERFGYKPAHEAITYNIARAFLTHLQISQLADDFRNNAVIHTIIHRYHEPMHKHNRDQLPTSCTPKICSYTLADLVRTIYLATQDDPNNDDHRNALKNIYHQCLITYNMSPSREKTVLHDAIKESQRIIQNTSQFQRRYFADDAPSDFRSATRSVMPLRSKL